MSHRNGFSTDRPLRYRPPQVDFTRGEVPVDGLAHPAACLPTVMQPDGRSRRAVVVGADPRQLVRDLEVEHLVEVVRVVQNTQALDTALGSLEPALVFVETDLPDEEGFDAIRRASAERSVGIVAVTPDPISFDEVRHALAAGAHACLSMRALRQEGSDAIERAVAREAYLSIEEIHPVLAEEGAEGELTAKERSARLQSLVIGLIPLAGVITAFISLLWRRYLGTIGVRPVDLAIDPTTRIADVVFTASVLIGLIGPQVFVGSWLDLIRESSRGQVARWLDRHARLGRTLLALAVFAITVGIAALNEVLFALFAGPLVTGLLLAKMFDLDDDLPAFLRVTRLRSSRAIVGAAATAVLFLGLLSYEVIVRGPEFGPEGESGWLAPSVLGFNAIPVRATVVDGGAVSEMLYLGGNADLYVLVDPCDGDRIDLVSVGSTKLTVIDRVSCD